MKTRIALIATLIAAVSCGQTGSKSSAPAGAAQVTPNVEIIVAGSQTVPQESTYASTVEVIFTAKVISHLS